MANAAEQVVSVPRGAVASATVPGTSSGGAPPASSSWRFGVAERLMFACIVSLVLTVGTMTGVGVAFENLQYAMIAGLVTVVFTSLIIVSMIRRAITHPLREMTQVYQNAGKGNYRLRSTVVKRDEFGELATTVNTLLDNVAGLIQTRKERDKLQASIVKLLEDVSNVAEGNLTVQAEVTADVTGAIADAFNFTVGQLRTLVENVQKTTQEVTVSALELQQASGRLAEMSVAQAGQIGTTMTTVAEIAESIERVSADGAESSKVAHLSLANARSGTELVASMIKGMNRIRERVQETGRRTKRLGERSQEIGEIVQLIEDIADRTAILALNASIQAASAGEAGRGFTVVSEEIQRLAERSAEATKRIAVLVKTIQSETNETVVSMEEATREVVDGSALADQAGTALQDIQSVAQHLAELVEGISVASEQQAERSATLAKSIGEISVVTNQNALGASESAEEIGVLVARAERLRQSVSAFRLA
jgi:twitching motility protein PilJ